MTASAARGGAEDPGDAAGAAALGAPLLRLAERVLKTLARAELPEALAALQAFTDEPSPARYLAATRAFRAGERRHKMGLLGRALGARRAELGMDGLARAGLAPELVEALRALPPDARNGRRLAILADLLETYRLVDARAAEAQRALHLTLGPVPLRLRAERRRRTR
jgi:hypothetical protein